MIKFRSIFLISVLLAIGLILVLLIVIHVNHYLGNQRLQTIAQLAQENNHSLTPIASNQWYSSVYKNFPSQPLFAMPLAFKIGSDGLSLSYPNVLKTPNTIFGSYSQDVTIGSNETFLQPQITGIGDWDIQLKLPTQNSHQFNFFLAHGVPYVVIHATTNDIVIHFSSTPQILSQSKSNALVLVNSHYYLFVAPQVTSWNISANTITLPHAMSLFVGLLDKPENKGLFLQAAQSDLIGTQATYAISQGKLKTTYTFQTTNGPTLFTLYPHQYNSLQNSQNVLGTYTTIRGSLELVKGNSFTTSIPLTVPPVSFSPLKTASPELVSTLKADIDTFISQGPPNSEDYYLGTWFGQGTTLIQLADTLGQTDSKNKLLSYMTPIFINSLKNFAYHKSTTSLVANKPEFGNEVNNDHHFHYGYYIRTASILAMYNKSLINQLKPVIDSMVSDIANINRKSTQYPYLRNFDTYESHSWADGFANFADGNNQESSSEAINAWYGVYLWGKVTNNQNVADTGLYLYNQEILGTKYYWFDIKNFYNSGGYKHAIGSIVWGGKVDFATWFSPDTNMIYGIQLLPVTPASSYLGTLPNFNKYLSDYFASGGNIQKSWGNLFLIWEAFYHPKTAIAERSYATNPESNVPKSLFLYELLSK